MHFPKTSMPRAILFDLGDTLINFSDPNPLPHFREGANLAHNLLRERNLNPPPLKKFTRVCRRSWLLALGWCALRRKEVILEHTLSKMLRSLHLPHDRALVLEVAERFYRPLKKLGVVEEGLHEILDSFSQYKHPMGIVSNTMVPGPVLDAHLEEVGLLKYFPARIYSCDIGVRKPRPEMFLAGLRALNAKPQSTVFVGDKPHLDIKGAARMGMITVLKVRDGLATKVRHKPDYVIKHLCELPRLLEQMGPRCQEQLPLLPRNAPSTKPNHRPQLERNLNS